jgi:DNA-binding transcriptional LysR family regulator
MNLQHLSVIVAVGKHMSLTKAAKDLGVGQPALTKQLHALEESIKTKLYFRKGRGIELTQKGKDLYRRARPILRQADTLMQTFGDPAVSSNVASLTVGGSFTPSSLLLPSVATRFCREHPRLQIQLRTLRTQELEEAVLKGEVELAVGLSPAQSGELVSEPYRSEKLVFFAHPDDPRTRIRKLKRRDLASIPLVVRGRKNEPGATEEVLKNMEAYGVPLNIAMRCDTAVSVKTCVRDRLGVGLLHLDHVKTEIERGDFKLVKISGIDLKGQSYIVYHRERRLSSLSQEFLWLLRKARSEIL